MATRSLVLPDTYNGEKPDTGAAVAGAAVTILRKDTWELICESSARKPRLCAYHTLELVGVEGSLLTIHGCATVSLQGSK